MNRTVSFGQQSAGQANNFGFLRLFLATAVVWSHSLLMTRRDELDPLLRLTNGQLITAVAAVYGFFCISGYLVAMSWQRSRGLKEYLAKRVLRIYPAFIVACLFSALIAAPLGAPNGAVYLRDMDWPRFLIGLATLADIHTQPLFAHNVAHSVNSSLWTIKIEFICYALIALIGIAGLMRRPRLCVAVAALFYLSAAITGIPAIGDSIPLTGLHEHLYLATFFMVGMVMLLYRESLPYSGTWALAAFGVAVVASLCEVLTDVLPLVLPYLLLYLAFHPAGAISGIGARNDLSYGIYLYAWPVQQLVVMYCPGGDTPWVMFFMTMAILALIAYASWRTIEKPALSLKKRMIVTA